MPLQMEPGRLAQKAGLEGPGGTHSQRISNNEPDSSAFTSVQKPSQIKSEIEKPHILK